MIGILIVTHGRLGQELLTNAETIVGHQEAVRVLGLDASEGPDAFEKKVQVALQELYNPDGVLILVDMFGGTPCNVALRQCRGGRWNFELVTGVNMPILLAAVSARDKLALTDLAKKVTEDGPRTILRPLERLKNACGAKPSPAA
ncbi:MAG TPA: PTS sugar transporter subunit IIA [Elusimicrobiota bacterium]|nr:PTS sugar transporter subunit IIA [Elusimicrobiota bacterium]